MSDFPNQVEKVIREGYEFKFGDYISRGFDIAKKEIGLNAAFLIVFFVIAAALSFIPIIGQLASSLIVTPCLMAGFYLVVRKIDDDESRTFGDYFKGFDYLSPLLVAALIQMGIFLALFIPIGVVAFLSIDAMDISSEPSFGIIIGAFALMIPIIYLGISWSFTPFLIIFHEMKAWSAMEASRKIIGKNWFMFFFFGIVVALIVALGMLGLFIALLFTIPAGICMNFAAFRDIVGMPNDGENDILDHLIEEV
jgi:hypothetical protein